VTLKSLLPFDDHIDLYVTGPLQVSLLYHF